jgi:hypothetical protein
MEKNLKHTIDIFDKLKGQHILINREVLRFIAIAKDDYDYLYVMWNGRKISYYTILDRISQLKDRIDNDDYNEMCRISRINHIDSSDIWLPKTDEEKKRSKMIADNTKIEIDKEIEKYKNLILLSEVCLEIT